MIKKIWGTVSIICLVLVSHFAMAIQDGQLVPPNVKLTDRYGVNIVTGNVRPTLDTVSIGGPLGLSHSISLIGNDFGITHDYGYIDKFSGSAKYITLFDGYDLNTTFYYGGTSYKVFSVMRLASPLGFADFKILVNNKVTGFIAYNDNPSNFTYEPLSDTGDELVVSDDNEYLIWTRADGTKIWYWRGNINNRTPTTTGYIRKIEFPNGLVWNIDKSAGVTTNTGYQLKYQHFDDTRGLSPEKQNIKAELPAYAQVGEATSHIWAQHNPKQIVAINRAYEYCSAKRSEPCSLTQDWPTVTFQWPGGMPQALFLGDSVFTVKLPNGKTVDYHYQAQDVMLHTIGDPTSYYDSKDIQLTYRLHEKWSARLLAIKTQNSNVVNRHYVYKNKFIYKSTSTKYNPGLGAGYIWSDYAKDAGILKKATSLQGHSLYTLNIKLSAHGLNYRNRGDRLYANIGDPSFLPGKLELVTHKTQGSYHYEMNLRNYVTSHTPVSGPAVSYHYDNRGNLTEKLYPNSKIQAHYPASCTSANRLYCNKPDWIKDRKGNKTTYAYHPQSGQVSLIVKPANASGEREKISYQYNKYYAYYHQGNGSVEKAPSGVWLLAKKTTCQSSNLNGTSCDDGAGDKVVKVYHYGPFDGSPNNLQLKGITVTAQGDTGLESRTTCYQYDKYSHKIGVTKPKANQSSCDE